MVENWRKKGENKAGVQWTHMPIWMNTKFAVIKCCIQISKAYLAKEARNTVLLAHTHGNSHMHKGLAMKCKMSNRQCRWFSFFANKNDDGSRWFWSILFYEMNEWMDGCGMGADDWTRSNVLHSHPYMHHTHTYTSRNRRGSRNSWC